MYVSVELLRGNVWGALANSGLLLPEGAKREGDLRVLQTLAVFQKGACCVAVQRVFALF